MQPSHWKGRKKSWAHLSPPSGGFREVASRPTARAVGYFLTPPFGGSPKGAAKLVAAVLAAALLASCGYRISGQGEMMPKTVKTIAIPAFTTPTARYRFTRLLPADITREFESRSRFAIVSDPRQADAVLEGSLSNFETVASITDPKTSRATAAQVRVVLSLKLTETRTGKVLFERKAVDFFERYEIALDPNQYFDESNTAVMRLSRDIARDVVSSVLEDF